MNPRVILLFTNDRQLESAVADAAAKRSFDVLPVRTCSEAMECLKGGVHDVAAAIVDLDPGMHGAAILHAIEPHKDDVRIVAATSLEACYMEPILRPYGAECLLKPATADAIARCLA
jgi:ActR/RegA family two-component response regulator